MNRRILTPVLLAALMAAALAASASAADGGAYLTSRQTGSGGFAEPGGSAAVSLTEWAVLGLAAAGKHPATMHRHGGKTAAHYLASKAHGWSDAYSLERGILAAVAMGKNPSRFGGRNLVSALRSKIGSGGRIGGFTNSTYWGVLALRAARSPVPSKSISYIKSHQGSAGGFGYAAGTGSDSNDTAAAVMALRSAGTACSSRVLQRAYAFMHTLQRSDHGYALTSSAGSDSQSTGWVVQARIKCHLSNSGALRYLAARKHPNGMYSYRTGVVQTPAWVTSQVLPAVNGKAYPIR
jgi:hypothetical protein